LGVSYLRLGLREFEVKTLPATAAMGLAVRRRGKRGTFHDESRARKGSNTPNVVDFRVARCLGGAAARRDLLLPPA